MPVNKENKVRELIEMRKENLMEVMQNRQNGQIFIKSLKEQLLDHEPIAVKKKREKAQALKYLRKMGEKLRNGRGKIRKNSDSKLKQSFKMDINPVQK